MSRDIAEPAGVMWQHVDRGGGLNVVDLLMCSLFPHTVLFLEFMPASISARTGKMYLL